jgi:MoxR-like ATPase
MTPELERFNEVVQRARAEISQVIIGQQTVVDMALITLLTRSHALIEGIPGLGKTLLVRTLAQVLDCPCSRIQFTPDLMPSDITGTNIYNLKTQAFTLIKGPVFTTFLLADEINRAPAKTQSALLQAMQERQVTLDGECHTLDPHFTVFATQNPIESEGTYPLPEAQKDRFTLKINMTYPLHTEEVTLASRTLGETAPEALVSQGAVKPVIKGAELPGLAKTLEQVTVRDELIAYAVALVRATREHECIIVGAGPRATQALLVCARAAAAMDHRAFVIPDDIKSMADPVLQHRLIIRPEFEIEGLREQELVQRILQQVTVPR